MNSKNLKGNPKSCFSTPTLATKSFSKQAASLLEAMCSLSYIFDSSQPLFFLKNILRRHRLKTAVYIQSTTDAEVS